MFLVDSKVQLDNKIDTGNDTMNDTDNDTLKKQVTWSDQGITYSDGIDTTDISETLTLVTKPDKCKGSSVKQPYIYTRVITMHATVHPSRTEVIPSLIMRLHLLVYR